jgi:hypothetical protein
VLAVGKLDVRGVRHRAVPAIRDEVAGLEHYAGR